MGCGMPHASVKTIKDLIFWQYSKLISSSAGFGANCWGFRMNRFNKLRSGEISWSGNIREYVKEHEESGRCVYCGTSSGKLTLEHMLPSSRRGPNSPDNAVMCCAKCNQGKGGKRLYEWAGMENRNRIPRIAEGKYLKLLYSLHEKKGTLDSPVGKMCRKCDMRNLCKEYGMEGEPSVYCIEGCFTKKGR